jgi:SPP1 family predicted phage head-tail adaptor|uniref:Putative head tail adaptor n=1 Tax=Siphoviridae sp. cthL03 TaxID=2825615 RepID=A0A8S5PG58_9CAUD|nr:phage head closure protein [uncultured Lachnoclostridium sp.]DAE05597.1 MAG TPA: putative head tail adaptor [Siphoviridae sp. cthL03]
MNVNPGELNKRIEIKTFDKKTGESILVRKCWAKITNTSGKEIIKNNVDIESVESRFLVRYSVIPVTKNMEIHFRDMIFDIQYTNEYGYSKQYVEILATFKDWNSK